MSTWEYYRPVVQRQVLRTVAFGTQQSNTCLRNFIVRNCTQHLPFLEFYCAKKDFCTQCETVAFGMLLWETATSWQMDLKMITVQKEYEYMWQKCRTILYFLKCILCSKFAICELNTSALTLASNNCRKNSACFFQCDIWKLRRRYRHTKPRAQSVAERAEEKTQDY